MKVSKNTLASTAIAVSAALGVASAASPARADDLDAGGEIGPYFMLSPGVAGDYRNPAVQISPGLSLALGHTVRWHLMVGYSHMSGLNGIDVRAAMLGIPINVTSSESMGVTIEPLIDLFGTQGYFESGGAAFLFSSGFGVQGVLNFSSAYVSIAPLNFQFQYAAVGSGGGFVAAGGGFGMNMPIRLSGGLRF